jgi:hypothetical protein
VSGFLRNILFLSAFQKRNHLELAFMPLYRFNTRYGAEVTQSGGVSLDSTRHAWQEATRAAGEILRDLDGSLEPHREWRMDVSDNDGNALFSLRVIPETYVPRKELKKAY